MDKSGLGGLGGLEGRTQNSSFQPPSINTVIGPYEFILVNWPRGLRGRGGQTC